MNNPFQPLGTVAPKQKPKAYTNDSIVEAMRNLGSGVTGAVAHDVAGKVATDALASLFGSRPKTSGDLQPNQSIDLTPKPRMPERSRFERSPFRPMRRPEISLQPFKDMDMARIREELTAVRQELKALSESIKTFHRELEKAIDEVPVNPGVYHINFLARIRSILKILKEQIDDSSAWLNLTSGRKQKKQYWGMYKKHGTKFGLSSERTLATQAG